MQLQWIARFVLAHDTGRHLSVQRELAWDAGRLRQEPQPCDGLPFMD